MRAINTRLLEIDVLRGVAILAMAGFHLFFDLVFFAQSALDLYSFSSPFFWLGRIAAVLFVGLAGVSLYLRFWRRGLNLEKNKPFFDFVRRGIFIFGLGLLITIFTFLFFPQNTVWFGVLHLIGIATILSIPLVNRPKLAGALGLLVLILGIGISLGIFSGFPHWLAIFPFSFSTFDYFPLFPWLGVFWLGIFLGSVFYPNAKARFADLKAGFFSGALAFLGKNSLWIYFVHQPVLVAILALTLGVKPF